MSNRAPSSNAVRTASIAPESKAASQAGEVEDAPKRAPNPGPRSHRERAQALFDQRRARNRRFGPHAILFQEACWDILLELFLCYEEGVDPPATSLAHDAAVPRTTAARSIGRLRKEGLVSIWTDEADARVRRIRLTAHALTMMRAHLEDL